jgi:hypothetical protein
MKLTLLGTRAEIEARLYRHRRHSALVIERNDARIMIDRGADWLHCLRRIALTAIVHAHADHAAGPINGAPCPVYARRPRCGCSVARRLLTGALYHFAGPCALGACGSAPSQCVTPFVLLPSPIAGRPTVPALLSAQYRRKPKAADTLRQIDIYRGDRATMSRSMARRKAGMLVRTCTPIVRQLAWCAKAHVRRAIFTYCGSPIVRAPPRSLDALIDRLGRKQGIEARAARDGDRLSVRAAPRRNRRGGGG